MEEEKQKTRILLYQLLQSYNKQLMLINEVERLTKEQIDEAEEKRANDPLKAEEIISKCQQKLDDVSDKKLRALDNIQAKKNRLAQLYDPPGA